MDKFIYIRCIPDIHFFWEFVYRWKIQITYNQITDKKEPPTKTESAHKTWFDKSK
jgi:hypothetical protein